ncbi:MAG: hypothetical protein LBI34_01015 [Puniceicoccales bacterium]|jgi:hypothetical protein|nr:hypothetical protein [Puniceicoccales bacterium]
MLHVESDHDIEFGSRGRLEQIFFGRDSLVHKFMTEIFPLVPTVSPIVGLGLVVCGAAIFIRTMPYANIAECPYPLPMSLAFFGAGMLFSIGVPILSWRISLFYSDMARRANGIHWVGREEAG